MNRMLPGTSVCRLTGLLRRPSRHLTGMDGHEMWWLRRCGGGALCAPKLPKHPLQVLRFRGPQLHDRWDLVDCTAEQIPPACVLLLARWAGSDGLYSVLVSNCKQRSVLVGGDEQARCDCACTACLEAGSPGMLAASSWAGGDAPGGEAWARAPASPGFASAGMVRRADSPSVACMKHNGMHEARQPPGHSHT